MTTETPIFKPRTCARECCGRTAVAFGGVVVFADQNIFPNTEGVGITMDLPLCSKHSENLEVSDVLTKEGWDQLTAEMFRRGKVAPDPKYTRVRIFGWYEAHDSIRGRYV